MRCHLAFLLFQIVPSLLAQKCCKEAESNGTGYSYYSSSSSLNTTTEVSFCLWVTPEESSDSYTIVNYVDPRNESQILLTSSQIWIMDKLAATGFVLTPQQPTQLCLVWGGGVKLYINGLLVGNNTSQQLDRILIDFAGEWFIGNSGLERSVVKRETDERANVTNEGFRGKLCGMTIWGDVISSEFISQTYINSTKEEEVEEEEESDGETKREAEEEEGDGDYSVSEGDESDNLTVVLVASVTWEDFDLRGFGNINETFCEKELSHGIRLGDLDPVASKFVILFLVIIGVVIGFGALFLCSEREIANKRANKRKQENNVSVDSVHSVT